MTPQLQRTSGTGWLTLALGPTRSGPDPRIPPARTRTGVFDPAAVDGICRTSKRLDPTIESERRQLVFSFFLTKPTF